MIEVQLKLQAKAGKEREARRNTKVNDWAEIRRWPLAHVSERAGHPN
jgi:hypothetical protein